jgi:hypothetical protein
LPPDSFLVAENPPDVGSALPKRECLSKLILFGERSLSRALAELSAHYHGERNHQGKGKQLLFPLSVATGSEFY